MNERVFISYARQDGAIANELARLLKRRRVLAFFDAESLVAGALWEDQLLDAIKSADVVVVLLSSASTRSRWVERELQQALKHDKVVMPVLLDQHGTENWVWPLVADRMAFKLEGMSDVDRLAHDIESLVRAGRASMNVSVPNQRRRALFVLGVLIVVVLVALLLLG